MLDEIIVLAENLAMPVTIVLVLFFFLFFVVRPFFAQLFSKERLDALAKAEERRRQLELKRKIGGEGPPVKQDETTPEAKTEATTEQDKIARLAESNPERAGDLVKQWLKRDE